MTTIEADAPHAEKPSKGGGNALRAAVLGANDGLVSNLSLVMGVAGATANGRTVLVTGLAGLIAGACSMAMGEWLSVNNSRELSARQIAGEKRRIQRDATAERKDLAAIYEDKGLDKADADVVAEKVFTSLPAAIDTLSREELGVDPEDLGGSAWAAAASSFCLFALGAAFPILPFLVTRGSQAQLWGLGLSALVLALIGAVTSRFTGRSVAFSAGRQLVIGLVAAAVTYGAGRLIGATVT